MTEEELILFLQVLAKDAGKNLKQEDAKAVAEKIMGYKDEENYDRRTQEIS